MNLKAARLLRSVAHLGSDDLMVEIGCVREPHEVPTDGFSTFYLASAAKKQRFRFISVDSDPHHVAIARRATKGLPVRVVESDGRAFLAKAPDPIRALYLDGAGDPGEALAQFKAAKLTEDAVVIVDDVQNFDGNARGKGSQVLDALEASGYKVAIFGTEPGYLMAVAR